MVRAAELSTGGGEATTGNEGGGHFGAESGGGVHLSIALDAIRTQSTGGINTP